MSTNELLNHLNRSLLEPTTVSWWQAEAGAPAAKLALENIALDALQTDAESVFSAGAVHQALLDHGPQLAFDMALLHFNERQLRN